MARLFAGGGARLKILQAMIAGVPLVSTELGAEGLEVRAGQDIRTADTADEMASAIPQLISESSSAAALARRAPATRGGRPRLERDRLPAG